jgi:aryl-alcohol dehydrogenase-like predicted oxidoreductase
MSCRRSSTCVSREDSFHRNFGLGDTAAALHQVIDAGVFDSAQIVYNMLNPSAAEQLPINYPAQDYGRLLDHTRAAGVGVVGIRVLAGGALSGSAERHRLRVRRPSRSVRPSATMPTSIAPAV